MAIISYFPSGGKTKDNEKASVELAPVSGIQSISAYAKTYIKWTDPDDISEHDETVAEWAGTELRRKAGSVPANREDGVLVLDSVERNAYSSEYFCDSGLNDGVIYYYQLYPYTKDGIYTDGADSFSVAPISIAPGNVSNIRVSEGDTEICVNWADPEDTVADGVVVSEWAGTKLVYKTGGYPASPEDGTLVVNSTKRNEYNSTGVTVSGRTNGTTYYFALFPYAAGGAVNTSEENRFSATPFVTYITKKPSYSGTFTYNGEYQAPAWKNYDPEQLEMRGSNLELNAGDYTTSFVPASGYAWSDGSKDAYAVTWSIKRAQGSFTLETKSVTLNYDVISYNIPVEVVGDGNISAKSSNKDLVSVAWSDSEITLYKEGETGGNATVTVSLSETSNCYAPSEQKITVTVEGLPERGSFYNMSWADISTVCKYGLASDYFEVGDEKAVSVGGTSYAFRIIGFDHDEVDDSSYGRTYAGMTIEMKTVLDDTQQMNSTTTNTGGWEGSGLRTALEMFYSSGRVFPSALNSVIVPVKKYSNVGRGLSSVSETTDHIFLLSIAEIFGEDVASSWENSSDGEGTQYEYYANGNSEKKTTRVAESATYWSRSSMLNDGSGFCCISETGGGTTSDADAKLGVAFAFCV